MYGTETHWEATLSLTKYSFQFHVKQVGDFKTSENNTAVSRSTVFLQLTGIIYSSSSISTTVLIAEK